MSLRRARCWAALLALLAATGLSGCGGTDHADRTPKPKQATPTPAARPPVVVFLGDSYTAGGGEALPEQTYAADTARMFGWQVIIGGRGGTGFMAPGKSDEPFHVLFTRQLAWRPAPDLVIVSGGHNDWRYPPTKIAAAAKVLLTEISTTWPSTPVVMIGPIWGSGQPRPSILAIRDRLQLTATELKIPFIDPIAEKWITGSQRSRTGNAAKYILRDQTHPTAAGHRYLATRLAEHLKRLGLTQPSRRL